MTALTELDDKLKAFAVGGVDYVTKPIQEPELLARVGVHLQLNRLQKELEDKNLRLEGALDTGNIVNVAIALERPLLVRGEPGTGKTLLSHSIAKGLGKRLLVWNIKSTTKAKDGLYIYDTDKRFLTKVETRRMAGLVNVVIDH